MCSLAAVVYTCNLYPIYCSYIQLQTAVILSFIVPFQGEIPSLFHSDCRIWTDSLWWYEHCTSTVLKWLTVSHFIELSIQVANLVKLYPLYLDFKWKNFRNNNSTFKILNTMHLIQSILLFFYLYAVSLQILLNHTMNFHGRQSAST